MEYDIGQIVGARGKIGEIIGIIRKPRVYVLRDKRREEIYATKSMLERITYFNSIDDLINSTKVESR